MGPGHVRIVSIVAADYSMTKTKDIPNRYGLPASSITCNANPLGTPVPYVTQAAKNGGKQPVYTAPANGGGKYGGGSWPNEPSSTPSTAPVAALKKTSDAPSTQATKTIGVMGVLSLGFGAMLIASMGM